MKVACTGRTEALWCKKYNDRGDKKSNDMGSLVTK